MIAREEANMMNPVCLESRREVTEYIDRAILELVRAAAVEEPFDVSELRALAMDAEEADSTDFLELIRRRARDLLAAHRRRNAERMRKTVA